MKILHVYKNYPPVHGGIERHLRTLAIALAQDGEFEVQVLVTNQSWHTTREIDRGVEVVRAGRQLELARTPLSVQLGRELSRLNPDIAHLHIPYPMGELAQLWFGRSHRLVLTYHSDVIHQRRLLRLYRPLLRRVLRLADRIIVTSLAYAQSSRFLGPFEERWVQIPHGIDPTPYQQADPNLVAMLRGKWPGPLVLFVGAFRYYKGLSFLVEAARRLPGTVVLVGSGPLERDIRTQIERLGLTGRVVLAGSVDDRCLPAFYQAADVFVLPSIARSEAFGIVQLEAMASGLPVVSTELGTGTSVVNVHGETGFVVPPRDSQALADAINRLLSDPGLRTRFGTYGRARVATEYSRDRMVEQTAAVYRTVMGA